MTALPASVPRESRWPAAVLALLGLSSVVALHAAGGNPLAAVALPLAAVLAVALWKAPLRASLCLASFLMLALEGEGDASGKWRSPLYGAAMLLHSNLNLTLPVKALRFSGFDLVCAAVGAAAVARALSGLREGAASPRPLLLAAWATLGSIFALVAWGLATGGDAQQVPWQTHQLAFVALLALLFSAALRGRADAPLLGKLLFAAASIKAAVACWTRFALHLPKEEMPTATSHHDSLLFALACAMLLARFWERPVRATLRDCLFGLPLLFLGMVANNRRLVWVELLAVVVLLFAVTPRSRLKRGLLTGLVACIPLGLAYVAVGWSAQSALFKPVAMLRSVVDSKVDRSSATRDVENYNLLVTLRQHPILGAGFGHEYVEQVKADDISSIFPQYRYIPHNSVLGLWAFGGALGFFGLLSVATAAAYFAARAYRFARAPLDRAAALVCLSAVLIWILQAWGDMGAIAWHGSILLGGAAALAGQLAVQTGAWE